MDPIFSTDDFPCGCVVTTLSEQTVICANHYFYREFNFDAAEVWRLADLLTPASIIVLESYILPMLLHQGYCQELQLTLQDQNGQRIPVLVNAQVQSGANQLIYWVFTSARQRDQLYQELVDLRNDLEAKAARLELLSQTDELTGLLNRRAFIAQAEPLLKQAAQQQRPCAFLLLDVDHFKHINDQHGHSTGDAVLRQLGEIFRQQCREHDVFARIGGEEFAMISVDQSTGAAVMFAQQLLQQISNTPIEGLRITVSIGIATADQLSFEQLYKNADQLLYQAKRAGRNQLVAAQYPQSPRRR